MKRVIVTIAMTVVSMMSYSQEVTSNGSTFFVFDHFQTEIPTYEWYNVEGSSSFYMDGSYEEMKSLARKIVGDKINNPSESFYINEYTHHMEWVGLTINGKKVEVTLTKNMYDSTVSVYFPNHDGKPDDVLKK